MLAGCGQDAVPSTAPTQAARLLREIRREPSTSMGRARSSGSARPRRGIHAAPSGGYGRRRENHGTGGGFSNYLKGEVDIVDASRAAKPDELSKAKAPGTRTGHDSSSATMESPSSSIRRTTSSKALRSALQLKAAYTRSLAARSKRGKTSNPPGRTARSYCTAPTTTRGPSSTSHRGDRQRKAEAAA